MKKAGILLWLFTTLVVLIPLTGCQKKGKEDKSIDPESVVTVTSEDGTEEISGVPAVITGATAGCYELQDDGSMKYVTSLEQYTEVLYLGEVGEFTYEYKDEERSSDFMKCYVDYNGEMTTLWILKFNVKENVAIGVVINTCLLYSKDKMDKITDKEVTPGTLVLKDISYKPQKFQKIRVPEMGDKDYFIQLGDFSSSESDVQVAMIFRAAMALGEGKEKQKRQLLQNAVDGFPSSMLINMIYDELNTMDGDQSGSVSDEDMGGESGTDDAEGEM